MNSPQVSILMPVRNEEEFLPAALDSLFRQTLEEWELIVVDDGSTDATPRILAEAARRDSRVRLCNSPGTGLPDALNFGLAQCRTDLVARMDGDDICHPRRLERQLNLMLQSPEFGLVACGFRNFPRAALGRGMADYEKWQNGLTTHGAVMRDLFVESPFVHPSVMFRRREVEEVGGYRAMGWAEDYDLWLRLAAAGTRFARLPEILFFWRERPGRATRTMADYAAAAFRACKVHHLRRGFLADSREVVLAGAGLEGRAWRRALAAEGIRVGLWVDVDPRKIGRELHGSPVVGPGGARPDGRRLLITVGTRGAREGVRRWALESGFVEGADFICVT